MAPLLHPEEIMLQFTYKLKLTERVKAKCSRHPRYNPRERWPRRYPWRLLYLFLALRPATRPASPSTPHSASFLFVHFFKRSKSVEKALHFSSICFLLCSFNPLVMDFLERWTFGSRNGGGLNKSSKHEKPKQQREVDCAASHGTIESHYLSWGSLFFQANIERDSIVGNQPARQRRQEGC